MNLILKWVLWKRTFVFAELKKKKKKQTGIWDILGPMEYSSTDRIYFILFSLLFHMRKYIILHKTINTISYRLVSNLKYTLSLLLENQ